MAQKVTVTFVDDLNGGEAHETVRFGLDGVSLELDLSEDNAEKLRETLAPYIEVARKAGSDRKRGGGKRLAPAMQQPSTATVRAWALANGHKVTDRGRIPAPVMVAFLAAAG